VLNTSQLPLKATILDRQALLLLLLLTMAVLLQAPTAPAVLLGGELQPAALFLGRFWLAMASSAPRILTTGTTAAPPLLGQSSLAVPWLTVPQGCCCWSC
jgi:hypothetical protein